MLFNHRGDKPILLGLAMRILGYCHKFVLACRELQTLRQVQNKAAIFLKIWLKQETSQEKAPTDPVNNEERKAVVWGEVFGGEMNEKIPEKGEPAI
jgi:hypothetical protein